jgi:hypothetical protein
MASDPTLSPGDSPSVPWSASPSGPSFSGASPPGYPAPGGTGYPAPGYGYPGPGPGPGPAPAYPGPVYGYPPGYGQVPVAKTNALAVASLVSSLFFWVWGVGAILGIVFGFIARSQIKRAGRTERGSGMALAGIIIGFATLVIAIVVIVIVLTVVHHCHHNGSCSVSTGD